MKKNGLKAFFCTILAVLLLYASTIGGKDTAFDQVYCAVFLVLGSGFTLAAIKSLLDWNEEDSVW